MAISDTHYWGKRDEGVTHTGSNAYVGGNGVPVVTLADTVGNLPTASDYPAGAMAYATDGRKNGETGGNGSGVLVFADGSNWIAVDTGQTVAA